MKQCGVGPPGVVLQVDADAVHASGEHALRRLNRQPGRSLHRNEDVSEGEPGYRWIGLPERVTHRTHRLGRLLACQGEKVDNVAAAAINRVRLPLAAVHGLHIGEQQRRRETLPEDRHNIADALVFQERRPKL